VVAVVVIAVDVGTEVAGVVGIVGSEVVQRLWRNFERRGKVFYVLLIAFVFLMFC
jgi:hypothetical protein